MKQLFMRVALAATFVGVGLCAHAETLKVWTGEPLTLHLPVGEEVRVIFPTGVDVQVPMGVAPNLKSLAPNPKVLYWTAKSEFDKSRIFAAALDGKSIYILDILASPRGLTDDVVIEDPVRVIANRDSRAPESTPATDLKDPAQLVLTRHISQLLYAPKRLLPTNPDISEVETPVLPGDFPLLRSERGEDYELEMIGQWFGYGRYITAIMVSNLSPLQVPLRMQNVRGRFTQASSQHIYLGPAGTLDDRTTIYLHSDVPFQDAVVEDGYAY